MDRPREQRRQIRTPLRQQNPADAPSARDCVHHRVGAAQQLLSASERQLVDRRRNPTMTARRTDIGAVRTPVERIGDAPAAVVGRELIRAAARVAQVFGPRPRRVKHESLPVAFAELGLHRVIHAAGSAVAAIDAAPVRKRAIRQWTAGVRRRRHLRLIQIRRPRQLHRRGSRYRIRGVRCSTRGRARPRGCTASCTDP